MTTERDTSGLLEDYKVPVKLKIAALWTSVMFCYVYGDIFVLQQPGHLQELIDGTVWYDGPLTQSLLLSFAISMSIPGAMIFLTLVLKPNISRWTNISLGVLFTAFTILIMVTAEAWAYYVYLGVVESLLTLLIVWYAWKWPRQPAA